MKNQGPADRLRRSPSPAADCANFSSFSMVRLPDSSAVFTCCPSSGRSMAPTPVSTPSITQRWTRASVPRDGVRALSEHVELHGRPHREPHLLALAAVSRHFSTRGEESPFAEMLSYAGRRLPQSWRARVRSASHLSPAPRPSLHKDRVPADGSEHLLWTTFTSGQVDIDVRHAAGRHYLTRILDQFQDAGIRVIRLDAAAGYAIKKLRHQLPS